MSSQLKGMNIAGIGVVFTGGRGLASLDTSLRQGFVPPQMNEPSALEGSIPAYRVPEHILKDKSVLKGFRRADRFCRMAVLAAWDAVQDSGVIFEAGSSSLGIIMASALGPHSTTFGFLDNVIDYGDNNVSPKLFSHSVHNTATFYIAKVLDSRGPCTTLTQFAFSFHEALIAAEAWLAEGRCDYVLVGGVDETHTVMEHISAQKLRIANDGRIRPFDFSESPIAAPGEGAVFFLVTRQPTDKPHCRFASASTFDTKEIAKRPDIRMVDADGMAGSESPYRGLDWRDVHAAGYSPIFGSTMIGTGFHCAAAALMLKGQLRYACPIKDNPHGLRLCERTEPASIERIECVRFNCLGKKASVVLTR